MALSLRSAVPATEGGKYHPRLAALRQQRVSGVYAITDASTGAVLYIGESHTGRLFDTITRHFRAWSVPKNDPTGRREGGVQYDREAVRVAWTLTPADEAQDAQYAEIQRLQPADNLNDGATIPNPAPRDHAESDKRLYAALAAYEDTAFTADARFVKDTKAGRPDAKQRRDEALAQAWAKYLKVRQTLGYYMPPGTEQNPPRRRFDGAAPALEYTRGGKRYRHEFRGATIEHDGRSVIIRGPRVAVKPDQDGREWLYG